MPIQSKAYNGSYTGEHLNHVAFPLGGIGAGTICLEGTGALSHISLRGQPDVLNEPLIFAALCVKGQANVARVLEGPVPPWKVYFPWGKAFGGSGSGGPQKSYGLPRCRSAEFTARFPFGTVKLVEPLFPLETEVTGWSPFTPGDADASSLPVAGLEYRFRNTGNRTVEAVFSFHARNFMAISPVWPAPGSSGGEVLAAPRGFVLSQAATEDNPAAEGAFSATVDDPAVKVNCVLFRGGWFDPLTMVWKSIRAGAAIESEPVQDGPPSPGGSLYVPFRLEPGEEKTIRLRLAWYVPCSSVRAGADLAGEADCSGGNCGCTTSAGLPAHRPWYAGAFDGIAAITDYWRTHYEDLRARSAAFSDCFYDTTLPPEVVEAVAANLAILKTPTVQRQPDGRLWCWEGCHDEAGCCHGSCTHVWNYAQALPHLFPELERSLRHTEFNESQDVSGHQAFRSSLPIRPAAHDFHAAADGQLGGIMKVFREWRISGDTEWLRALWPAVKQSLDYCIETWDPDGKGALFEPHHNTYDIEFWGPDGMCTSFYLGALRAAVSMGEALGDPVPLYEELLARGRAFMESELWDGEYFIQKIQWQGLRAGDPVAAATMMTNYTPEALEILRREGPKYQYGAGCLSDGVLGAWLAAVCGVGEFLDRSKLESHLLAVHRYNLEHDLSNHANPQRPTYALGDEGGLLLATWPKGGELSLPFVYSDEVWTGIEYQVAAHLMLLAHVEEGLEIVRTLRDRYDGRVRNPFDEYECGHWYARAMASYALLQGLTGARYDAVEKTLAIRPSIQGDFRAFLCTATGYGTVGVRDGKPFVEVKHGFIPYERLVYQPARR
jgi:uncharacterized protein (DUF608 family)